MTNYQVPGYGYEEIALARAQVRLGHEVVIVTSNFLHPPGRFYGVLRERFPVRQVAPREEDVDGVKVIRLASFEVGRRVWIRGLEKCLAQLKPDTVHCHNLLQFQSIRAALIRATRRGSFGLVVDDHMLYSVMRRGPRSRLFYFGFRHVLGPILARNVDRFTAATQETRQYLARECGVRSEIPIMPLGVDPDVFTASSLQRQTWHEWLKIPQADIVVLYTGKIIPSKRLDLLVAAGRQLLAQGEPIQIVMVGDADIAYQASLQERISVEGDAPRIRFLPSLRQQELAALYAAADVAVWPGTESMAILEAMSASLPVIVSQRSAYAELVTAGAGLAFNPDDETSLAGAIRALLPTPTRNAMGAYGRSVVERNYSWQRSAERYLSTYMEIHQEKSRR